MSHPMFQNKKVVRLPDANHPGVLMNQGQYIADAANEAGNAKTRRSVQVMALPDSSGTGLNFTLDLDRATKEQLKEAADFARSVVPDTSTLDGMQRQAEIRLNKLQELIKMNDWMGHQTGGQYYAPAAPPIPPDQKSWPGALPQAPQLPQAPPLPERAFTYGETPPWSAPGTAPVSEPSFTPNGTNPNWMPQVNPPAPATTPKTGFLQSPVSPWLEQKPAVPEGAPSPTVRITFWLPQAKFPISYHQVDIQRNNKTGQPVAVYLAFDNRFTGSTPFLADSIEGEFGIQIGNEPQVYGVESTGLVHEFLHWTIITLLVDRVEQIQ